MTIEEANKKLIDIYNEHIENVEKRSQELEKQGIVLKNLDGGHFDDLSKETNRKIAELKAQVDN